MDLRLPTGGLIPLSYQYNMLVDEDRCTRFQRAIAKQVPQGGVALEAGAGTGILSFMAAQKARKVYTVERDPQVAAAARAFVRANGMEGRIEVIEGSATEFVPPEPVDVVICEMLHVGLVNEQQVPVMNAIRRNLTRAFPRHPFATIPGTVMNYAQLVNENQNFYGYETKLMRYAHPAFVDPRAIPMSTLEPYWEADFAGIVNPHVDRTVTTVATEAGEVNAMRILTQAALYLDEKSLDPSTLIDWFLLWLVVPIEPMRVQQGQSLQMDIRYEAGCPLEELSLSARPATADCVVAA